MAMKKVELSKFGMDLDKIITLFLKCRGDVFNSALVPSLPEYWTGEMESRGSQSIELYRTKERSTRYDSVEEVLFYRLSITHPGLSEYLRDFPIEVILVIVELLSTIAYIIFEAERELREAIGKIFPEPHILLRIDDSGRVITTPMESLDLIVNTCTVPTEAITIEYCELDGGFFNDMFLVEYYDDGWGSEFKVNYSIRVKLDESKVKLTTLKESL